METTFKKQIQNKWTLFWDTCSGGRFKTQFEYIFIEATGKEAIEIFKDKFDRNPENVSCSCCGKDYSIDNEYETLEDATAYYKKWENQTHKEFIDREDVLVMYRSTK